MDPSMQRTGERCSRCLQPVPRKAGRCPNCGERLSAIHYLGVIMGVVTVFVLILVAGMVLILNQRFAP